MTVQYHNYGSMSGILQFELQQKRPQLKHVQNTSVAMRGCVHAMCVHLRLPYTPRYSSV